MATLALGNTIRDSDQLVQISSASLMTHVFITGNSGSGKTGAVMQFATQAVLNRIPLVLFDIKGDLLNIANVDESTEAGRKLKEVAHFRLLTPGAFHGEPVNLLKNLQHPTEYPKAVASLLEMIGVNADPIKSPEFSVLCAFVKHLHQQEPGLTVDILMLILLLQEPPITKLGVMDLEVVFSFKERAKLVAKLNNLLCTPSLAAWRVGAPMDFEHLLHTDDGKTPVVIYSVSHITDEDARSYALNIGIEALVTYMRKQEGAQDLKLMTVFDEMLGLMPPYPSNPPTKRGLMTLLKQARAFGIGLVLSTQNPVDLDYKGLSNCSTWVIGRLQTERDRRRVVQGVCGVGAFDDYRLAKAIGALKPRQFLLAKSSTVVPFTTMDAIVDLSGPISAHQVKDLYRAKKLASANRRQVVLDKMHEAKRLSLFDSSYKEVLVELEYELELVEEEDE